MDSAEPVYDSKPVRRFRQPFAYLRLVIGSTALCLAADAGLRGHSSKDIYFGVLWGVLGLVFLFKCFGLYWELRPEGLVERRLTSTRVIAYDDVKQVGPESE